MSTISELTERGLAKPPRWLPTNVHYEVITGSEAYGVTSDNSDYDVLGWAIPHKDEIFPHLKGEILGFGRQIQRFEQYQQHHIWDAAANAGHGRNYDVTIYGIVKYFMLAMENNPNIVDSLFVPANCILHSTNIANMVRDKRKLFLHKGLWHKFKGYAYSQAHKIESKEPPEGKRRELVEKYGYDTKYAYHLVRLMGEAEMMLTTGDLDLQVDRERLKAIRRGEWSLERIREWFTTKEKALETAYEQSPLPHTPREPEIKTLLLECLEEHFGDLSSVIVKPDALTSALRNIAGEVDRVRNLL